MFTAARGRPSFLPFYLAAAIPDLTTGGPQFTQFTGEELQVKFLSDSGETALKY
jgi:hypothetical protein